MARPREFNIDDALEGAMQIFWKNGYGATNLPDLLKSMNITRGSFYKAFGDKKSVYIEALKRYDQIHIKSAVTLLEDEKAGTNIERLSTLFSNSINDDMPREERRGCLMCNAMVELGPTDAVVARLTSKMYASIQRAIVSALIENREACELTRKNLNEKSVILTNLYFGSHAISKSGQPAPNWSTLIQAIIGENST
ncbi:TetR/AcrR family transcriptional regulator [Sneathiella marina]|uniref:TetR/AcrR family transcriptional regulator n=1 Tax=Sneathiella marina TaxID=2950108 RepID=A0ABY4W5T4_9PROT|nr:TetR/AcrR family transcriptional regulator [Sneathiella marina]USG62550.1 TetR/AcrR family transcriptional regulator [Sneathiella marina]